MKEEAAMLRKQVIVAWRLCGNNLQPRERIGSRLCTKGYRKWERPRSRCQEKGEEIVKTHKSKTRPVSNWRCQRQAGALKALQRALELDLPRVRGAIGECGGAGKSGTAKDARKTLQSNFTSRRSMEEEDASLKDL